MDILFYEPDQPFHEFSNFHRPRRLVIDGRDWKTTEHYFQACKFLDPVYPELIREADTPNKAFLLAQRKQKGGYVGRWRVNKVTTPITLDEAIRVHGPGARERSDWPHLRLEVMRRAVRAKFSQNPELSDLLLGTGTRRIVENSPRDDFWGIGKHGTGQNQLGLVLMEVREELRRTRSSDPATADGDPGDPGDRGHLARRRA